MVQPADECHRTKPQAEPSQKIKAVMVHGEPCKKCQAPPRHCRSQAWRVRKKKKKKGFRRDLLKPVWLFDCGRKPKTGLK